MEKFVKLCKKPFLISSAIIFVVFLVFVIVISCLPHGSKYSYKLDFLFYSMKVEYVFEDDNQISMKIYENGELVTEGGAGDLTTIYKITGGKLYIKNIDSGEFVKIGSINAYRIKFEENGITDEELEMLNGFTMKCQLNCSLRDMSISFIVISGVVFAGCLTILILDKKGKLTFKKNEETQTEELDVQTKEIEDIEEETEKTSKL